jgi:alpha-1,6-mannosyltransferase
VILYAITGLAAAGLEAIMVALLRLGNLKAHAVEFIALALAASLLYLIAVWAVEHFPPRGRRRLIGFIFIAGMVFRATLFPLYPSLSDDLLRYRWEGRAQLAGINPYRIAPNAPQAQFLRDETWPAVNGKEFTTAYGPLTELTFRETWRMARHAPSLNSSVLLMKLPALVFDLGSAVLLAFLLARLRLPVSRVLIYYLCPLAVVEFAASGHNDSIAVFSLLAALLAIERYHPPTALAALTASALAKLFAVFLAPVLLVREWRCLTARWGRPLLWPVMVFGIVCWPFRDSIPGFTLALAIGSGHWRNNDSLFGIVTAITGSLSRASWIYIAAVAATSLILAVRRVPLVRAAYLLLGVILTGAANCFPWYLTWILPLLAVFPNSAWLLLMATSVLSYQLLVGYQALGVWQDSDFLRALEYLPFYALLVGTWLLQNMRREPHPR